MNHRLQEMANEMVRAQNLLAVMVEAIGETCRKLAETKSTLAVITRDRRERLEELERQFNIETESPQDP